MLHLAGPFVDTHSIVGGIIRACGGTVASAVAQSTTDALVIGRGEKGEGGKPNGKGERPESSAKYINAFAINERREAAGKPPILIIYEEALLAFILSAEAETLAEAAGGRAKRRSGPAAPKDATDKPYHQPDLRAIRFTSIAQQAHGRGEPGAKGGVLADALAARRLQPQNGPCRRAERQSDVCLDGPPDGERVDGAPPELAPELIMICWARCGTPRAERRLTVATDDEPTVDAAPPPPAAAAAAGG